MWTWRWGECLRIQDFAYQPVLPIRGPHDDIFLYETELLFIWIDILGIIDGVGIFIELFKEKIKRLSIFYLILLLYITKNNSAPIQQQTPQLLLWQMKSRYLNFVFVYQLGIVLWKQCKYNNSLYIRINIGIKDKGMDWRLLQRLQKMKENCLVKINDPPVPLQLVEQLTQAMISLKQHFQKPPITKLDKIDKIVNKVCKGGSDMVKDLKSFCDLQPTQTLDFAIANAIVKIIQVFVDNTVWYWLLCSDLKNSHSNQDVSQVKKKFRDGIQCIKNCIQGKKDQFDKEQPKFYEDQLIKDIVSRIEKLLKQKKSQPTSPPTIIQPMNQKNQFQLQKLRSQITELQEQNKGLKQDNVKKQKYIQGLRETEKKYQQLVEQFQCKKKQCLQFSQDLDKIKGQNSKLQTQLDNAKTLLHEQKSTAQQSLNKLTINIQTLTKDKNLLEQKIKHLEADNKRMSDQVTSNQSQEFDSEKNKLEAVIAQRQKIDNILKDLQDLIDSKRKQQEGYIERIGELEIYKQQMQKNTADLVKTRKKAQQEKDKIEKLIENLSIQKQQLIKAIEKQKKSKAEIQQEIRKLKASTPKQFNQKSLFFLSDIIQGYQIHSLAKPTTNYLAQRDYLVQYLQKYCKKPVARTKLLFQHDDKNLMNFHEYIDGITNFLVLTKLENKNIIAAYSQNKLDKYTGNNGPSFISCLTEKITVQLDSSLKGSRATSYNDYYIIFGNEEFRLHPGKKQVLSYLGYQYSYFRPKYTPEEFMGLKGETIGIESFEVHKVFFEGEE